MTQYLEQMDIYNKQQQEKRAANINSSENNSNDSGNGSNNSGSINSNLAYLDSRDSAIRNLSGGAISNHPKLNSSGGGSSGNNGNTIQYVPILVMCCPNILKNEPCYCGH